MVPFAGQLISQLTSILLVVARNPSKPHFNHYLFESLSLVVRYVCKQNPQAVSDFEVALFPIFQQILQQDVAEFIPYVFQIFALCLDFNPNGISEAYMSLFPFLLAPVLWDKPGNIHPLVRLLRSYITKGSQQIVQTGKLGAILGVFQKLIASKANDHEGFLLMQALVEHMSPDAISASIADVFRLLFQRLQSSKTVKYTKNLITFFCFYVIKYGAPALIQVVTSIQANMFPMVLDRILIPDLQKISDPKDKKICAVGVTKILCEAPETFTGPYSMYWGPLLQSLIGLFELPEDSTEVQDEHFAELDESAGYQAAYSHLAFSGKDETDILKGQIPDAKLYLAASLHSLSVANPGKIGAVIATIAPPAQEYLTKYLQVANIQLM
jgi:exportin-2 (importin alpha re-exporter)